jgi:hypothetical protein
MLRSQMHVDRPRVARWVVPIGVIAALLLLMAMALPQISLADTPTPNPLDPIIEPPIDPLGNVSGLVGPLIAIGVLIVLVGGLIGAGITLSRIGGHPAPAPAPEASGPAALQRASLTSSYVAASLVGRAIALVLLLSAMFVGAAAGREITRASSIGGMSSIGAAFVFVLLGLVIVALGVPGIVALVRRRQMSPAIATVLATAALLGIGAVGGSATFAVGGIDQVPAPLQAAGRMQVEVRGGSVPFSPRAGATADCTSDIAGATVVGVAALDAGELGSGTLRASVGGLAHLDRIGVVELFIDGADVVDGSAQPFWNAPLQILTLGPDGLTGNGSFEHARLVTDQKEPTSSGAGAWPAVLSGTISWTCDPFALPLP